MNVTAIGLQAPKWVRASASAPASTPAPAPQSQASPHQVGRDGTGVPALVSSATQHALLLATQAIGSPQSEGLIPPAQQARAALLENPELEDRPFGSIVSRLARGEPLAVDAPEEASDTPATDVVDPDASIDETLSEPI